LAAQSSDISDPSPQAFVFLGVAKKTGGEGSKPLKKMEIVFNTP
jgi:hypothetical protein